MNEKLSEGLKKLSLDFSTEQIGQLETYCSCVLEFNKTYNLMKADFMIIIMENFGYLVAQ